MQTKRQGVPSRRKKTSIRAAIHSHHSETLDMPDAARINSIRVAFVDYCHMQRGGSNIDHASWWLSANQQSEKRPAKDVASINGGASGRQLIQVFGPVTYGASTDHTTAPNLDHASLC